MMYWIKMYGGTGLFSTTGKKEYVSCCFTVSWRILFSLRWNWNECFGHRSWQRITNEQPGDFIELTPPSGRLLNRASGSGGGFQNGVFSSYCTEGTNKFESCFIIKGGLSYAGPGSCIVLGEFYLYFSHGRHQLFVIPPKKRGRGPVNAGPESCPGL